MTKTSWSKSVVLEREEAGIHRFHPQMEGCQRTILHQENKNNKNKMKKNTLKT